MSFRDGLFLGTGVERGALQMTENGMRHRLTGRLSTSARGPVLETHDGHIWALDLQAGDEHFIGQSVVIEGVQAGFDRVCVEWIRGEGRD